MLLELKNVCYTYNKDTSFSVNALENINLQIPEGQFVGVIGHTGSGKSTLIQHFNGLIRPTDGQVLYMGIFRHRRSICPEDRNDVSRSRESSR